MNASAARPAGAQAVPGPPQRRHLGAVLRVGQITVRRQQIGQATDLAPAHRVRLALLLGTEALCVMASNSEKMAHRCRFGMTQKLRL